MDNKLPDDFDEERYLELNPDVKHAGVDAAWHYINCGASEGRIYRLPDDFDEERYLELNPDVKHAGVDAAWHYINCGASEGRFYSIPPCRPDDSLYHRNSKTKRSSLASHANIWESIRSLGSSKKDLRVLEIGSRSVVSDSLWKNVLPSCNYTGFDVLPGKNVDVVGDAHFLSTYFPSNSFDLIISFAVFEHLAAPWIVAEEISKVLDIDGYCAIETHFSFSEHELPWHFFQFNSNALEILFCKELGFDVIDSGLDNPIVGRFSYYAADYLRGKPVTDLYCHSSIIAKKVKDINLKNFNFRDVARRLHKESMYPDNPSKF